MNLQSDSEVARTREMIQWMEQRRATLENQGGERTRARELTIQSLKKEIRQMTEDIARCESLQASKP